MTTSYSDSEISSEEQDDEVSYCEQVGKKAGSVVTVLAPQFGDFMSLLHESIKYGVASYDDDKTQQAISAAKLRVRGKSFLATTGTLAVFATPAIVLHKFLENHVDSLHRIRSGLENVDKFAANNDMPNLDAQHVIMYAAISLALTTLLFSWLARSVVGKKAIIAELTEPSAINAAKERGYFVKFGIFAEPPLPEKRKNTLIDSSYKGTGPKPGEVDGLSYYLQGGNKDVPSRVEDAHSFIVHR